MKSIRPAERYGDRHYPTCATRRGKENSHHRKISMPGLSYRYFTESEWDKVVKAHIQSLEKGKVLVEESKRKMQMNLVDTAEEWLAQLDQPILCQCPAHE